MAAQIGGPTFDEMFKPGAVTGVEGAGGFFITGQIAGHGGHEAGRGIEGEAGAAGSVVLAAGLVNEAAEGGGGSVWLEFKPLPVAGQERDFAADDAQARAAGAGAGGRGEGSGQDLIERAAQIEVDLLASMVSKDEDWIVFRLAEAGLEGRKELLEGAGGDEGGPGESGIERIV